MKRSSQTDWRVPSGDPKYEIVIFDQVILEWASAFQEKKRKTCILLRWEQKPVEQNSQIVEGYREVGMMK